jgi:hypothetical protein
MTTFSLVLASSGIVADQPPLQGSTRPEASGGTLGGVQLMQEEHSSTEPETPQDQFDELAQGMHQKSIEDWLAHLDDHEYKSKISADERVLHMDTSGQFSKLLSEGCADDPMWRDVDGDGCEIYKFLIESGRYTREAACNGGGNLPPDRGAPLAPPGLRGALVEVVADATAMIFCPATCGMCSPTLLDSLSAGQQSRLLQLARP